MEDLLVSGIQQGTGDAKINETQKKHILALKDLRSGEMTDIRTDTHVGMG